MMQVISRTARTTRSHQGPTVKCLPQKYRMQQNENPWHFLTGGHPCRRFRCIWKYRLVMPPSSKTQHLKWPFLNNKKVCHQSFGSSMFQMCRMPTHYDNNCMNMYMMLMLCVGGISLCPDSCCFVRLMRGGVADVVYCCLGVAFAIPFFLKFTGGFTEHVLWM